MSNVQVGKDRVKEFSFDVGCSMLEKKGSRGRGSKDSSERRKDKELKESDFGFSFDVGRSF